MASIIREVGETFGALIKGFSVTFRTMFRKTVTENYPYEPVHFQPRYRGIHVLHRDENGLEKCVGCFLCAAACPANCIYIEAAENSSPQRISAGERYASVYNIDYSRCIFCGYCVEACPTDAITHGHGFELATYDISALVYRKDQLLESVSPTRLIFHFRSAVCLVFSTPIHSWVSLDSHHKILWPVSRLAIAILFASSPKAYHIVMTISYILLFRYPET